MDKGLLFYYDWLIPLSRLTDEEFRNVVNIMVNYHKEEFELPPLEGAAGLALDFIVPQIDRMKENVKNGQLGGRPRKEKSTSAPKSELLPPIPNSEQAIPVPKSEQATPVPKSEQTTSMAKREQPTSVPNDEQPDSPPKKPVFKSNLEKRAYEAKDYELLREIERKRKAAENEYSIWFPCDTEG